MRSAFGFKLAGRDGAARAGTLRTPHGVVQTPVFMPVGTAASVKSLSAEDLTQLGAEIILSNTYHLWLRPGERVIEQSGGLHHFMRWFGPLLTDSGGFQVSSLGLFKPGLGKQRSRVDDDGVTFTSHLDGSLKRLTAERSIRIQARLGADIIMAFDEATPDQGEAYAVVAMERTHHWLLRSKKAWETSEAQKEGRGVPQALFGIIQGGNYEHLRQTSAQFVAAQGLPGIAIGGGSIGAEVEQTLSNIAWVKPFLPVDVPFYAMGMGTRPSEAVAAVKTGVDMFDCVAPTRWARTGYLYQGHLTIPRGDVSRARFVSEFEKERLAIGQRRYTLDQAVIDDKCDCATCKAGYSRAYLHHLFKAKELTYYRLASIHNVWVMVSVVRRLRQAILAAGQGSQIAR